MRLMRYNLHPGSHFLPLVSEILRNRGVLIVKIPLFGLFLLVHSHDCGEATL